MKKFQYLFIAFVSIVAFSSCLDDDNTYSDYADWREANNAYFNSIMTDSVDIDGNPLYTKLEHYAYPNYHIYYRELVSAEEDARTPLYTSTVQAYYAGHLFDTEDLFDYTSKGNPSTFTVNGVISGWTLALMNMKEGAAWRVIIPWELAYGESGSGSIPPYSNLVFDMQIYKITGHEK